MTTYEGLWEYAMRGRDADARLLKAMLKKFVLLVPAQDIDLVYAVNLFEDHKELEVLMLTKDHRVVLGKAVSNATVLQFTILDLPNADGLNLITEAAEQTGWRIGFSDGQEIILKSETDERDACNNPHIANLKKVFFILSEDEKE